MENNPTNPGVTAEAILNAEAEHSSVAETETPEASDPTPATDIAATDIAALIAEAEQRGYLRGRNEAITERLESPELLAEPASRSEVEILTRLRPSVWSAGFENC